MNIERISAIDKLALIKNLQRPEGKIDVVLKTNFSVRPVFHRNCKQIIAPFMVCHTALLIYRLLENKLDQYGIHFITKNEIGGNLR